MGEPDRTVAGARLRMRLEVHPTAGDAQRAAARHLAAWIGGTVAERGSCGVALSGGSTPEPAFRHLAAMELPWDRLHVYQVDERIARAGSDDRNLGLLRRTLVESGGLAEERLHAMPVEAADPDVAAAEYARALEERWGRPPALDVVHLGLGADGHTASLFPGDPVAGIDDRAVALSAPHGGRRRMTLTAPVLSAARQRLWLVTGADKAEAVARLHRGDESIPAGRLARAASLLVADRAAAERIPHE